MSPDASPSLFPDVDAQPAGEPVDPSAKPPLDKVGIAVDENVIGLDGFVEASGKRSCDRMSKVCKLA